MKTIIATILLIAFSNAGAMNINWKADSLSAFELELSGVGPGSIAHFEDQTIPFLSIIDTLISPSGLWQIDVGQYAAYRPGVVPSTPEIPFQMSIGANLHFLGGAYKEFYVKNYNEEVSIPRTESFWTDVVGIWDGHVMFDVISTPDLLDAGTWQWISDYRASGPALSVPDAGNSLWLLVFGLLALCCLRYRLASI